MVPLSLQYSLNTDITSSMMETRNSVFWTRDKLYQFIERPYAIHLAMELQLYALTDLLCMAGLWTLLLACPVLFRRQAEDTFSSTFSRTFILIWQTYRPISLGRSSYSIEPRPFILSTRLYISSIE
jgi:hypothetical protein